MSISSPDIVTLFRQTPAPNTPDAEPVAPAAQDDLDEFREVNYKENQMKKLNVTIKLEMSIPEGWELVKTSTGGQVIKLPDGQFLDIAIEPMFASDPEETWTSTQSDDVLNDILDMIDSEDVIYELITH